MLLSPELSPLISFVANLRFGKGRMSEKKRSLARFPERWCSFCLRTNQKDLLRYFFANSSKGTASPSFLQTRQKGVLCYLFCKQAKRACFANKLAEFSIENL